LELLDIAGDSGHVGQAWRGFGFQEAVEPLIPLERGCRVGALRVGPGWAVLAAVVAAALARLSGAL
jgi:hypothetical protein